MGPEHTNSEQWRSWESAHVCPDCDRAMDLSKLDLGAVTTGVVECPHCEWAGQIEIRVVDARLVAD